MKSGHEFGPYDMHFLRQFFEENSEQSVQFLFITFQVDNQFESKLNLHFNCMGENLILLSIENMYL